MRSDIENSFSLYTIHVAGQQVIDPGVEAGKIIRNSPACLPGFSRQERGVFGNDNGNLANSDSEVKIYLMTYHSAKGLDFENVFIPGLNRGYRFVSELALKDDPDLESRLLYVAVTRSRENLFLSYNAGQPHVLLSKLPSDVVTEVNPAATAESTNDEEDFF